MTTPQPLLPAKYALAPLLCLLTSLNLALAAPEEGAVSDWQTIIGEPVTVAPYTPTATEENTEPEQAEEQQTEIEPIQPVPPPPAEDEALAAETEAEAVVEPETTLVIDQIMPSVPADEAETANPASEADAASSLEPEAEEATAEAPVAPDGDAPTETPDATSQPAPNKEQQAEEAAVDVAPDEETSANPTPETAAKVDTTEPEAALTGREIALKMDRAQHVEDATRISSMLIERRGQQLTRKMLMRAKRYGVDERTLIRFEEPADVRDTQYLSWVYEDPQKDDDLWVYFPSENMVRRISGGGKKGAFMRSDFANEDIEVRAVDDDTHIRLEDSTLDGTPVYVIESTPIPVKARDSSYSKRKIWINKEISLPLRVEFYDKRGKLLKILRYGGIKEIDGVWTATKLIMETPRKKSRTLMQYHDVTYNSGLGDDLFNQSTLKR